MGDMSRTWYFCEWFFQYKTGSVLLDNVPVYSQSCVLTPQPLSSALQPPPREVACFSGLSPVTSARFMMFRQRNVHSRTPGVQVPGTFSRGLKI